VVARMRKGSMYDFLLHSAVNSYIGTGWHRKTCHKYTICRIYKRWMILKNENAQKDIVFKSCLVEEGGSGFQVSLRGRGRGCCIAPRTLAVGLVSSSCISTNSFLFSLSLADCWDSRLYTATKTNIKHTTTTTTLRYKKTNPINLLITYTLTHIHCQGLVNYS